MIYQHWLGKLYKTQIIGQQFLEVDFIFLQIGLFEKKMVSAIVKFISVNKLYIVIALKSHTIR